MKKSRSGSIIAAVLAAAAAFPAPAQQPMQAGSRFGIVNTQRIMRDSRLAQQTQQGLEAEFQKRVQEIEGGPKEQMDRRKNALAEDMNARRQEALQKFIDKTNGIIKRVAEAEKLDIVFFDAAYANARIDLTDRVIKELDAGR